MKTVMEYDVIMASSTRDLEEKVNAALKKGWQPHGNIVVSSTVRESMMNAGAIAQEHTLFQAMAKYVGSD